jgi:Primosomal protein N'' (replication factor Y) - superfamily II helicase
MDQTHSAGIGSSKGRRLKCSICAHEWTPRKEDVPSKCPKCRSMRWNNRFDPLRACRRCGHEWLSRTADPTKCPSCQSVKWDSEKETSECRKCGHQWIAKGDTLPRKCPKCHSSKWDSVVQRHTCGQCGKTRIMKANSRTGLCPVCDANVSLYHCAKCDSSWKASRGRAPKKCPVCSSRRWERPVYTD